MLWFWFPLVLPITFASIGVVGGSSAVVAGMNVQLSTAIHAELRRQLRQCYVIGSIFLINTQHWGGVRIQIIEILF